MRDADGAIVDSRYDFGGSDSLPNVWLACTALAGWAVLEAGERDAQAAAQHAAAVRSLFASATDDTRLATTDTDEIVWAHVYRLRFAARLLDRADDPAVRAAAAAALAGLHALQSDSGAWFHEYQNPFVTASVLIALAEAERHGLAVDSVVVERGLRALLSCRAENGAVSYAMPRGSARTSIVAASCRMPLVELALWRSGDGGQPALVAALEAAFAHHDELAAVRKYDDHANRHGHGGFFFWYDMHARSEAIAQVEDDALRAGFRDRQRAIVLALPEIDGCFVDSHELGRSYGTAMALLTLAALDARAARRAR
jgi:hypothetical protein